MSLKKAGFYPHYSFDSGLGHLARCVRLAKALARLGVESFFVLNSQPPSGFLDGFKFILMPSLKDELENASFCAKAFEQEGADLVVLDSYEMGLKWESFIRKAGFKLCVIDDILREHECDFLLHSSSAFDYEGMTNEGCVKILGEQYALIDEAFSAIKPSYEKSVLFSLGGGGDLAILEPFVRGVIKAGFKAMVVVGAQAINSNWLDELKDTPDRLEIIKNASTLVPFYQKAGLYVGAGGTSIFELNAAKVPSLSFSLSSNQTCDFKILEPLGHFFHIDFQELTTNQDDVLALILLMLKNLGRLRAMKENVSIKIDALGAMRAAKILTGKAKPERLSQAYNHTGKELAPGLMIREVIDSDINSYLQARNLLQNTKNMQVGKIEALRHYLWWLGQNKRRSYLVYTKEKSELFIWDESFYKDAQEYLVGGWFSASPNTSAPVAAVALQWQLQNSKNTHPNATWIAIIKRTNAFVYELNKSFGFVEVSPDSKEGSAIKEYFKNPDPKEFYYVKKHL